MRQTSSIEIANLNILKSEPAQFRVVTLGENECKLAAYNRRDFYKISLVINGSSELRYADKTIQLNKPALVFTNPLVPYSWDSGEVVTYKGYFCAFTDEFLHAGNRMDSLQESTLFKPGGNPVYLLDDAQVAYLASIFQRMQTEVDSDYAYKYDLIRSQLHLIIHEALKMQPAPTDAAPQNAASRIANLFLNLLDKQFPVDSPQFILRLKKASDYAEKLAIHVNHLNAAVQETTGKSTTAHINDRIIMEAKSLLAHTDLSVAEVAFSLGFEYTSYFNNFFKKHTGFTPLSIRTKKGSVAS